MEKKEVLIITKVFCDVLGKYALMFGDILEKNEKEFVEKRENYIDVTMEFYGPARGLIGMITTEDFCEQLNKNLLDKNDEYVTAGKYDSVKEFINIVCAQFVSTMYGEKNVFDFKLPRITNVGRDSWFAITGEIGKKFVVEDNPVFIYTILSQVN